MTHCFSAKLLLQQTWPLDIQAIARTISDIVPSIGKVDGVPGQTDSAVLRLDDTQVVVQAIQRPLPHRSFVGNAEAFDAWMPQDILDGHRAYVSISCGGEREDIGSKELYAAAVHVVTTAACQVAPAGAIYWESGEILVHPDDFRTVIDPMMAGQMPVASWIGFRPVHDRDEAEQTVGMITSGLRQFLGREIELAPSPTTLERARMCLGSVVQRLMDRRLSLHDGDQVEDVDMALSATVRLRDRWLRRDKAAFVLITDDAVVDRASLRAQKQSAA